MKVLSQKCMSLDRQYIPIKVAVNLYCLSLDFVVSGAVQNSLCSCSITLLSQLVMTSGIPVQAFF